MLSGEDLTATIGALCFWADRGDEQAALDLNELVRRQSPEVMLAARAIQANALFQSRCAEWEMLAATVDLIAAHYRLVVLDVWSALFELERELLADSGCASLSDLLAAPEGVSMLGRRIALRLMGPVAEAQPLLVVTEH
jgi:hypothetical protein